MSDVEHDRLTALFHEARQLDEAGRRSLLDSLDDAVLRAELESLLAHDASPLEILAGDGEGVRVLLADEVYGDSAVAENAPHPERIGGYRVLGLIGRGGMGVVYEAEQEHPRRRVALKLIRDPGISRDRLRRFEHEAHVLGLLRHPGIAQIHEAGSAALVPGGPPQPYFALELVQGRDVLSYAREESVTLRERLLLLASIADALHHAHQRGVIHRDLKPQNILVDESRAHDDGTATASTFRPAVQPKILDFGVARLVVEDSERSIVTRAGQIIGTVGYMSPEQALGDPDVVDVRSDVYALGVIAWEMFARRRPYETDGLPLARAVDAIVSDEPARLGTIDPRLRGDVETIVAKAIEKEPDRRYASAAEFAADIRRFLADEPIIARRASASYQLRKFARRHRALVASVLAIATTLAFATAISVSLAIRATTDRNRAADALAEADLRRREAEWSAYRANVAAASAALIDNAVASAAGHLADTKPHLRGWEWRHLSRSVDPSIVRWSGPRSGVPPACTPDGAIAASAGSIDGRTAIELHDVRSGTLIRTVPLLPPRSRLSITSMRFDPSGERVAFSLGDGRVGIAEIADGGMVRLFEPPDPARSVTWSPSGATCHALSSTGPIHEIDAESGEVVRSLVGHRGMVYDVAYSSDGAWIATGGYDRTVRIWDTRTGEQRSASQAHRAFVASVAFSPDDQAIVSAGHDGRIMLWALLLEGDEAGKLRQIGPLPEQRTRVNAVRFSPDGRWVVTAGADATVRVFDVATYKERALLRGAADEVVHARVTADGRIIATGLDGVAWYRQDEWDRTTDPQRFDGIAIDDPSERAFVRRGSAGRTAVVELRTGSVVPGSERATPLEHVALTPDGRWLAAITEQGALVRLPANSDGASSEDAPSIVVAAGESVSAIAMHPSKPLVAIAPHFAAVVVVDLETMQIVTRTRSTKVIGGHTDRIAWSPDGSRLIASTRMARIETWNAETGAIVASVVRGPGAVTDLAWSPDGRYFAAACRDRAVRVWDARRMVPHAELFGHGDAVTSIAFTPDSSRLASGSADATIRFWDVADRRELVALRGHSGTIATLAFDRAGDRLFSLSSDGTLRRWDARPPEPFDDDHPAGR